MKKRYLLIAAGVMLSAGSLFAEVISELKFEQFGGNPVAEEQLLFQVQQRPGSEFNPQITAEDVKRLYNTGLANNVSYTVSRNDDGGLVLTFKVNLKPLVRSIKFEGNEKYTERELLNLLMEADFYANEPLNDAKLTASANKLREFYFGEGYYQATVVPVVQADEDGALNVIFRINEHLREKLDKVSFENNTVFSDWTLRYSIANQPWPVVSRLFDIGLYNEAELEADEARLRALYWQKGYLDFKVEEIKADPQADDPEYVDLTFVLFEGNPYQFTGYNFKGNTKFDAATLAPLIALKEGEVFNSDLESASIQNIMDFYGTFGYADVDVQAVRRANFADNTVQVDFEITEGRKYRVEEINITGNKITKEKVILRELAIMEGDPLDTNRVEVSRQRLLGMGYFNRVDATMQAGERADSRRVVFDVEEKDPYTFRIGGGFSDSDSLAGMVEFSNNNFDITNPGNLFRGGGQRFRVQAIVGLERYNFNVDFTEPWLFDIPLRFDLSGYGNYVEYDHWDEQRIGVKTSLTKRILQNIDEFNTATVGYKFEYVEVDNVSRHSSEYLRSLQTHDLVSQFSLLLNRDTRDNLLEPTSGYQVSVLGAVSPRIAGSSEDFYRTEARGSYYYSFWDKAIIWHVGAHIGVVDNFGGGEVPLYERYFLGGGETLRGFPYRRVSPVDENGDNVGGASMFLATTEISHPIWRFIRGAVFCDVGSVWEKSYRFNPGDLNVGVGYGLRIKVPVLNAPIKLDLAYPVLNNQDDLSSKLRFHFNMGFTW